jgi:two-component system sensor histidine kinase UhpB
MELANNAAKRMICMFKLVAHLESLSSNVRNASDPGPAGARLLLLMDHSPDFIELIGKEGLILGVSSAVTSLAGYAPEEVVGLRYTDLVHPEDCERVASAFAQLLAHGGAGPITLRYRRKDGSWRTIQASGRNLLDDPAARALVVLTHDMTDQLHAEALLSKANAELHRLSQQLISAHETERTHLARELHDDVGQILVGLSLSMVAKPRSGGEVASLNQIDDWRQMVREALDHLHRLVLDLRPPALDQLGLPAAVAAHVDRVRTSAGNDIRLDADANLGRLSPDVEITCFRIIQEALTNAVKHSAAKHIWVGLRLVDSGLCVTIRDDGMGFDVAAAGDRAMRGDRIGLLNMRERATRVGGKLDIASSPEHGTEVRATLPIQIERSAV